MTTNILKSDKDYILRNLPYFYKTTRIARIDYLFYYWMHKTGKQGWHKDKKENKHRRLRNVQYNERDA